MINSKLAEAFVALTDKEFYSFCHFAKSSYNYRYALLTRSVDLLFPSGKMPVELPTKRHIHEKGHSRWPARLTADHWKQIY